MAAETKKSEEKEIKEKENNGSLIENIRGYFMDVNTELRKVSWPSREDVVNLTRIVAAVIVISSIFLGMLSAILDYVLNNTHFAEVLAGVGLNRTPIFVILFAVIIGVTWWTFRNDTQKSY